MKGWLAGFKLYQIWIRLARQDIRNKYRRATLGPLWVTLTMGATIYFLGLLFTPTLGADNKNYIPSLAIGWVLWTFLSGVALESTEIFQNSTSIIKNIRLPYSFYLYRCCSKHLMLFAHNSIIIALACIYYDSWNFIGVIFSIVGMLLVVLNIIFASSVIAIACCRFRDLVPLVNSFVQLLFFASPILWNSSTIQSKTQFYLLNPFYYAIEAVRMPLIGMQINLSYYAILIIISILLFIVSNFLYKKFQDYISLWV